MGKNNSSSDTFPTGKKNMLSYPFLLAQIWRRHRLLGDQPDYIKMDNPAKKTMRSCGSANTISTDPSCRELAPAVAKEATTAPRAILKLNNFVESWDGRLDLVEQRMLDHHCQAILFVDSIPSEKLRRWTYQKTRLCRQLSPLLQRHDWKDHGFQTTVRIALGEDDDDVESITDLLGEIQKDPEIMALHFLGTRESSQDLRTIVFALVGLLSLRDRPWKRITFESQALAVESGVLNTETAIRKRCRRILEEASTKFIVPVEFV